MDFQRALVITGIAVVSYMMILAWQEDYSRPASSPQSEQVAQPSSSSVPSVDTTAESAPSGVPVIAEVEEQPLDVVAENTVSADNRIRIATDVLRLEIDPQGGDIVRLALPQYPHHIDTPEQPFVLMNKEASLTYTAETGLIGANGTDSSAGRAQWTAASSDFVLGEEENELVVDLQHTQDNGVQITKRFTFEKGSYLIRVNHIVRNTSNEDWSAAMYGQIRRDGSEDPGSENAGFIPMPTYLGGAVWDQENTYEKITFGDLQDLTEDNNSNNDIFSLKREGGWLAMVQHYFVSAWIPDSSQQHEYQALYLKGAGQYLLRFISGVQTVKAGEEGALYAEFYAGPKIQQNLEEISDGLSMTVDYGWLWFISQPIFSLMVFLQSGEVSLFGMDIDIGFGVGNWGVAIILLTFIIKAVFFKLSATSYRSMAKMRKFAPEIQRIKERNKNDRQKGQLETMELFKREKINPLGGCLPMLVQMPVFIALYYALLESVELRQAPFFLWINDLSAMDPYFVLPILMGASMFLQTQLNPAPSDPMQAQVMKWMPVIFSTFMLFFPSGLVLYWLTNNVLSIAQQWVITRNIENSAN